MSTVVLVVGDGILSDLICEEMSSQYLVVRKSNFESILPAAIDLALVLQDVWNPSVDQQAERVFRRINTPWLRGFVSFGEGIIGPLVRPGTPGCTQCVETRRLLTGHDRRDMREIQRRLESNGGMHQEAWASRTGLQQLAHLLGAEVKRIMQGDQTASEGKVCFLHLKTLNSSWHSFLPVPLCPVCSSLPEDSPEMARISLKKLRRLIVKITAPVL